MSIQWTLPDGRAVCELAVGLDVAGRLLTSAHAPRQLESAITYNLRLWRAVHVMALAGRVAGDGRALADAADHVVAMLVLDATPCPDPRDIALVADRNFSTARDLVGDRSAETALVWLLADWGGRSPGSFETWLLERIDARASGAASLPLRHP